MAKKATTNVTKKTAVKAKSNRYYADKAKYERAQELVAKKQYKKLEDAYVAVGGKFNEGYGYAKV